MAEMKRNSESETSETKRDPKTIERLAKQAAEAAVAEAKDYIISLTGLKHRSMNSINWPRMGCAKPGLSWPSQGRKIVTLLLGFWPLLVLCITASRMPSPGTRGHSKQMHNFGQLRSRLCGFVGQKGLKSFT